MHRHHFKLLFVYLSLIAGCSTPQHKSVENAPAVLKERDERCLSLEKEFIGMNSQDMRRLFGLAQENYDGAMPCVGATAKLRGNATTSSCDVMPMPYVLDRVQLGSPAQLAGLRDGDAVESVGDRPINFPMDFEVTILGSRPGSFIPVRVTRGERSFIGQVRVGAQFPGDGAQCSVLLIK
jgi:membrane-associated protease RseP (regulator of RpoE activity)